MMTGARRITVVALGRNAHTGATSATSRSRKRLPLPPRGAQIDRADALEEAGLASSARHHHAAEQQRQRAARGAARLR